MDNQVLLNSSLQLVFNTGIDPKNGRIKTKSKTFNRVRTDASGAALYAVARAFESLQQHSIYNIRRRDTHDIAGE